MKVLIAILLCALPARAMLTPRDRPLVAQFRAANERAAQKPTEMIVNDETDVRLDGAPCKYEAIPDGAEIIELALKGDGKTVAKLYFRSKGKP